MDGRVHVYTGDGKGKTTAALGLALRAAGWGWRTFFGQFMKGVPYGECRAAEGLEAIRIESFGWEGCIRREEVTERHRRLTRQGLRRCHEEAASGAWQVLVLDEILVACRFGLVEEAAILDFIERRRGGLEMVLTGRCATEAVMDAADLVTEMRSVKHYYDAGVEARKGVER